MQLCSCLATTAEGKHEQIAAIPILFLVLEILPYKCYFFLVTKPDSSQHFFKAATKSFHGFKVIHQKNASVSKLQYTSKVCYLGSWNVGWGPSHTVSPSPIQKPKKEYKPMVSHRATKCLKAWIFHFSFANSILLFIENACLTFFPRQIGSVSCISCLKKNNFDKYKLNKIQ